VEAAFCDVARFVTLTFGANKRRVQLC
jgi:hypothetical protein